MQNFVAVTMLGSNQPGLIRSIVKAIKECGCSVLESRMSILGNQFALMILLSGGWDAIAKVEDLLPRLEKQLGIKTLSERTEQREREGRFMPYAIEVIAVDQLGIVHAISEFFAERQINIEDMFSGTYAAAHTSTPMFQLHMTISVPTDVSISNLRGEFMEFCDQMNWDAIMEPVK